MLFSETGSVLVAASDRFWEMRRDLAEELLYHAPVVHGAKWQQLDVSQSDAHATRELLNVTLWYDMPQSIASAMMHIQPDRPWAENHFQERVGGKPINPGVEHANWPYHAHGADLHLKNGKYDHNYMERMWASKLKVQGDQPFKWGEDFTGYRFNVGDLGDVVKQLRADPTTRQAYLPIWFPEDTGATSGQRVPCTLGYHFIIREGKLHLTYNIRSCEIYRHFTNDVYMAVRLAQWMCNELWKGTPETGARAWELGQLTMNIVSLHSFVGDDEKIKDFT